MLADHEPKFKVFVQGTRFTLTKAQIEFDSPNYFTSCFLGEFNEAKTRLVELFRSPDTFPIVSDYLCGYDVLPLDPRRIVQGVTEATMIANLRADAEFYQLEGLIEVCDEFQAKSPVKCCILYGASFEIQPNTRLSEQINSRSMKTSFKTRVNKAKAARDIIPNLTGSPGRCKSFSDFAALAAIEQALSSGRLAESAVNINKRKLIGWNASYPTATLLELLILDEDPSPAKDPDPEEEQESFKRPRARTRPTRAFIQDL